LSSKDENIFKKRGSVDVIQTGKLIISYHYT